MPTTSVLFALFGLFTTGSAMVTCATSDPTTKFCTDSDGYIGNCIGNSTDTTCVLTKPCENKNANAACGDLASSASPMLKGKCDSAGTKCMFTTTCATDDPGTKYCNNSAGLIGKCSGTNTNCVITKPCEGKGGNAACGDLAGGLAMLKGKCDGAGTNCMFTTRCSAGDTATKYCNDSSFAIGKCNGANCVVTGQCTSKAKDAACGNVAGYVGNLKGKCEGTVGNLGVAATKCTFTPGSVACAVDATSSTYCNDIDGYIGKCNGDSCRTHDQCTGKDMNANCGNTSGNVAMLKGKCEADNKKCKYTKTVHVDYTVVADDDHKDDVHSTLQTATFKGELQGSLARTVVESGLFCPNVAVPSIPNGMLTCPRFTRDACTLSCQTSGYSVQHPAQRKCLETGIWQGAVGKCESSCLQPTGFTKNSDNKYEKGVTNGKVVCDNFFKGTTCQLVCTNPATQYANPDTTYKCEEVDGANTWTGVMGSCTETNEFSASAEIHLNPADDYEDIIAKSNGQFNNEFKAAVAAHLDGVLARNVMIVNIRASGGGGSRRLNERSVLVDYTVAYAKPLEGGLRGIR